MTKDHQGPLHLDLDENGGPSPADAPQIVDEPNYATPAAMTTVTQMMGRRGSGLVRWFWGLLVSITGFAVSLAAWDYVTGLLTRNPILGGIVTALLGAFVVVLLLIALRELVAFRRLSRLDGIAKRASRAAAAADLREARTVTRELLRLYAGRPELALGMEQLKSREEEILDADGLLGLAETSILRRLDEEAVAEVRAASRQVATVTAIVPLALADVVTALTANLRMIRRIAEIYGGRSGTLGNWRLAKSVFAHLVATGAVAVGDDLIGSIAGGGVLSKISRRFGEGVINGALTARVGVAAIEVCRPLPYVAVKRPQVHDIVGRALAGLFSKSV